MLHTITAKYVGNWELACQMPGKTACDLAESNSDSNLAAIRYNLRKRLI